MSSNESAEEILRAVIGLFQVAREQLPEDNTLCFGQVPVIAVMATGGGLRAMSAMFGHLLALQKLNLLDCVTYLTGASGSTW